MQSIIKSPYVSQQRTKGSSTRAGSESVSGSATATLLTFKIPTAASAFSKHHSAFDALMDQLESDPSNAAELAEAGQWVAERFYSEEGDTLRTARLRRGLSQKQLAALIGTSQPHIANLEKGGTDPLFSTMVKICEALSIDISTVPALLERQRALTERKQNS